MKTWVALLVGAATLSTPLVAQASLQEAAQGAAAAWLGHDLAALMGRGPTVVLEIPGANPSSPVNVAQAAELLRRYLRPAVEHHVMVRSLREVGDGGGFVELDRTYAVTGTTDVRRETVYLRFRRVDGAWRLTELRAAP
jgi:hypothetical protein